MRRGSSTTDDDDGDSLFSSCSQPTKVSQNSLFGDESETDTLVTTPSDTDLKSFFVGKSPSVNSLSLNTSEQLVNTITSLEDHIKKSQLDAASQSRQVTELKQHLQKLKLDHDTKTLPLKIPSKPLATDIRDRMIAKIDQFLDEQHYAPFSNNKVLRSNSDAFQHLNRKQLIQQLLEFQQQRSDMIQEMNVLQTDQQHLEGAISVQQTMHASLLQKVGAIIEDFRNEFDQQSSSYMLSLATSKKIDTDDSKHDKEMQSQSVLLREHSIYSHQMAFLHHVARQLDSHGFPVFKLGSGETREANEESLHALQCKLTTAENQLAIQHESQNHQIHQLSLQLASQNEMLQNLRKKNSQLEEESRTLNEQLLKGRNTTSVQGHQIQVLEKKLEQSVQQAARVSANLQVERSQWSQKLEKEIESVEARKRQAMSTAQKSIEERDRTIRDLRLRGCAVNLPGQELHMDQLSLQSQRLKVENEEMERVVHQLRIEVNVADEELSYSKQQIERKEKQIEQLQTTLKTAITHDFPHPDGMHLDNPKLKSLIALKDEAELNSIKMEQERHKAIQSAKALKIELKSVEVKLRQSRADNAKLESTMLQFVNGNDLVQNKVECLREELEKADKRVAQAEKERAEWELRAAVAKAETRKNINQHESLIAELKTQQDSAADNVQQLQQTIKHLETEIEKAQKQHFETQSVLSAVQSSLAEREGEVALIKVQLSRQIQDHEIIAASEKKVHQTAIDRVQRQHEEEISRIRKLLTDQHASNTKRNQDIAYLQNARHIHMLEDKVKELEYAMTITCQQHEEKLANLERRLAKEYAQAAETVEKWEKKDRAWQMQAAGVEAEYWRRDSKIKEMEQEVVRLYSKNLELIKELAKWTP
ncbi:hypothetical protein INT43_003143 [Umbelopsis isabellina]|uniref:Uncharacterized protein n=1 Tax=Mortierella isabellina TaxID=91625 RepID=A0A8H7PPV8_MORIS|nr:hypothetical protein INT43_003143 [Umbelopsis isabellina]